MSAKIIYSTLLSCRDSYLRKLNNLSKNAQNRRSGEKSDHLFETYINSVIPHGRHIYVTEVDMAMATMCAYPPYQYSLPHFKFLLRCFSDFPHIHLPDQESDIHRYNVSPSIIFIFIRIVTKIVCPGAS